jgi:hypothetical protein
MAVVEELVSPTVAGWSTTEVYPVQCYSDKGTGREDCVFGSRKGDTYPGGLYLQIRRRVAGKLRHTLHWL